ncbi:sulfate/molybdate ABC transporter ATP-binding protein [Marinospirillum alkaliphilum]|uniref:Sulfate transport system ATP-binding protein n=1 Tax=Marinospirillum alkaliphilum DSM 21637 TaxID=1122209 RepID=A0A1K1YV18_9GAMM|nr:TOBE-like domain-containing protein [Marinospirillum alkaliphilum]SFX65671.1 sulfate transport system ATP-binding protein [Marinospirillum alkaliphilum DSM 21637]
MSIHIRNVSKTFGDFQALKPLDLTIQEGEMVGLLGPSGSGKTTLLRIIAGLETCDSGQILFSDKDVTRLHVRDRKVGFVFQHYALFRHMTVAENVAFGLDVLPRDQRPDKQEIRRRVQELLERVQLAHLASRYPGQLSGGQKQRVALARALAMQPRVLLLDEPFGALDARVRKELRRWLRNLHDELGFTSVFVTHDQEEALEVSDRVVVMSQGQIEQQATPQDLYHQPASRFVYDFLGQVNVFHGEANGQRLQQGDAWVAFPEAQSPQAGQLYLRSHELQLQELPSDQANLPLEVKAINLIGAEVRLELEPIGWQSDEPWEVAISHSQYNAWQPQRGDRCHAIPLAAQLFVSGQDSQPRPLQWSASGKRQPISEPLKLAANCH